MPHGPSWTSGQNREPRKSRNNLIPKVQLCPTHNLSRHSRCMQILRDFRLFETRTLPKRIQAVSQSGTTGWQATQLKSQETILQLWTDVSPSFPWPQLVMARHSPQRLCLKCRKDPSLYHGRPRKRNFLQKHPFLKCPRDERFLVQGISRTKPCKIHQWDRNIMISKAQRHLHHDAGKNPPRELQELSWKFNCMRLLLVKHAAASVSPAISDQPLHNQPVLSHESHGLWWLKDPESFVSQCCCHPFHRIITHRMKTIHRAIISTIAPERCNGASLWPRRRSWRACFVQRGRSIAAGVWCHLLISIGDGFFGCVD